MMPKNEIANDPQYPLFLSEIKNAIEHSYNKAIYAVNQEMIALYQRIGELIVQRQTEFGWGKSVVEHLSVDLKLMAKTI